MPRGAQAQFLLGVPDAVIRSRLGEMVAARLAAGMPPGDQVAKHAIHLFQRRHVGDGALEHDDARAIHQCLAPFGLQRAQECRSASQPRTASQS
jgi:hypothetical protein